ncbi:MAG: transketolase [Candidatus Pacebacteria bacterium]|nr:transketolase [Candidatus Paceibacterota bacterium]
MTPINEQESARIELFARRLRVSVLDMLAQAGSGHLAGSLDMADVLATLYAHVLRCNPDDPVWEKRDRLVLSNGHIAPVLYAALAHAGFFPLEELASLRSFGSRLQGHPERTKVPGVETTSGPLGEGLPQAAGIALGGKLDRASFRTYCITSDGEHECGILWEAVLFASRHRLSTLTNIVARNGIQIGGSTEEVMPLEPLVQKYEAFNWHVLEVDGHNVEMFVDALGQAELETERPSVIIAHTIPGKGVPEIEGKYEWHGKVPTKEQAERWIRELR